MSTRETDLREILRDPENRDALRDALREELARLGGLPRSGITLPEGGVCYEEDKPRAGHVPARVEVVRFRNAEGRARIVKTTLRRSQPKAGA